jgi:hypothetical protein
MTKYGEHYMAQKMYKIGWTDLNKEWELLMMNYRASLGQHEHAAANARIK